MRLTWFFLVLYQGDGEFCVTALETSMHGRFRLTVLKAAASGAEGVPRGVPTREARRRRRRRSAPCFTRERRSPTREP